ncbi:G-type lectin S-receptor-like serine/threonine-protein kinase [Tanacetum coccineum]|uniref:G-type lectin S-receptor-like serine/threonine-protein kinase n=1 Tax=Tanacetum coccineum TaxID=301880 RepID=A0ABQ5G424_9ASTR
MKSSQRRTSSISHKARKRAKDPPPLRQLPITLLPIFPSSPFLLPHFFSPILDHGQQVAVKRLSGDSGQGIEEVKNEILLISKLQHRNLVKLLDPKKRSQLVWAIRFNIIQAIGRGLIYVHHDSCLRIIHRDLKCGNLLLDEKMNPKISDFGLARNFQMTQELANTRRIVGT